MNEHQEQELLKRAVAGDQAARELCAEHFGGYVTRKVETLYGTTPGMPRSKLTRILSPEDLAQEAWCILCYRNWPLRAGKGQPLAAVLVTFLHRTAHNLFQNVRRAAYASRTQSVATTVREGIAEDTRSILSKAANNEQHLRVRAWLDEQNQADQQLLRAYMLGEQYTSTAGRMGLSSEAVRLRTRRILDRFRHGDLDDFGLDSGNSGNSKDNELDQGEAAQ